MLPCGRPARQRRRSKLPIRIAAVVCQLTCSRCSIGHSSASAGGRASFLPAALRQLPAEVLVGRQVELVVEAVRPPGLHQHHLVRLELGPVLHQLVGNHLRGGAGQAAFNGTASIRLELLKPAGPASTKQAGPLPAASTASAPTMAGSWPLLAIHFWYLSILASTSWPARMPQRAALLGEACHRLTARERSQADSALCAHGPAAGCPPRRLSCGATPAYLPRPPSLCTLQT